MPKLIELKGKKFGRLIVLKKAGRDQHRRVQWECLCACGATLIVTGDYLHNGDTRSCGCLQRELISKRSTTHGKSFMPEYYIWKGMLQRCTDKSFIHYRYYGGRGITVCDRWQKLENFLKDMGKRPSSKHTIERIENCKGYYPENCIWATRAEQARNTRLSKANKTGVRGVSIFSRTNKYHAQICANGKNIHLGYFDNLIEATEARQAGELKYWQQAI